MLYPPPSFLKLSHFFLLIILLFNGLFVLAQNANSPEPLNESSDFCGTFFSEDPDPPGVYSRSIDPAYLINFEPKYYNIFFWGINLSDGTSERPLTKEMVLEVLESMNQSFNQFNICFILKGFDYINSDDYYISPGTTGENSIFYHASQNNNQYVIENSFNVYVPYLFALGYSGIGRAHRTSFAVNSFTFNALNVPVHEAGHNFNLLHTFSGWTGNSCERVTRDINDPDYNASDINGGTARGDRIHDTGAVPSFLYEQRDYGFKAIRPHLPLYITDLEVRNILTNPQGFFSHPYETIIENALIDYGFTQTEVNHIKFNGVLYYAYLDNDNTNCTYTGEVRYDTNGNPFDMFRDCGGSAFEIFINDVRNIMGHTLSPCRTNFTIGQGIRMREAIEDDQFGEFEEAEAHHPIDLFTRDHIEDIGQEPNIHTEIFWQSPDIWVRNQNDGFSNQTHQNPEYNPSSPNYVYVRVINKGCVASTGTEELFLHWAKAGIGGGWPALWNGGITNPILMGNLVYSQTIPIIQPGDEAILEFEWYPPNPEDYVDHSPNNDPWHFCLLSRIVSPNDPMAFPEEYGNMVKRNNNIASKNVTVVSNPKPGSLSPGGAIFIGNIVGLTAATFHFEFKTMDISSSPIFEEAEVVLTLNENTWDRWLDGGRQSQNIEIYPKGERQLIVTGDNAWLNNLAYGPGEWDVMYVSFNFLTKEVTNKSFFEYFAIQHDAVSGDIIGGESYLITRDITRPHFVASAFIIENSGEITFSAISIGEDAKYNWYAPDGTLIHSGEDFTFTGSFAGEYTLEVIAENDAHKDYYFYLVETQQNDNQILSLTPNPASTAVQVNYQVNNATNASLQLVKLFDSFSTTFTLNPNESEINLNIANYPMGIYAEVLIVDGQPVHGVQLIVN